VWNQEDAGAQPDSRCRRFQIAEQHERVEPVGVARDADAPVGRLRVAPARAVHHDDVLARPEGGKPTVLGGAGHGHDDRRVGARSDAKDVEADAYHGRCRKPAQPTRDKLHTLVRWSIGSLVAHQKASSLRPHPRRPTQL
jgi:hypothetical protein